MNGLKGLIENLNEIGYVHIQGYQKNYILLPVKDWVNEVHTDFKISKTDKTIEAIKIQRYLDYVLEIPD